MKEALRLASFDQRTISPQIWYDKLRESDDGRYSQSHCVSPKIDYVDTKGIKCKKELLKKKYLGSHKKDE